MAPVPPALFITVVVVAQIDIYTHTQERKKERKKE
jgi:hypothetical protein